MAMPTAFDPLVDLDGLWHTQLAERILPLPELPHAKYECADGRLFVSPTESGTNSYGEHELSHLIRDAARAAGLFVYGSVNLKFNPDRWIQPDVTILHELPETDEEDIWIPARLCTMVVEFVSPRSQKQDRINKPEICARGGIPYFMRVEIVRRLRHAKIELSVLEHGQYELIAEAISGQMLNAREPFPMSFDPRQLLP